MNKELFDSMQKQMTPSPRSGRPSPNNWPSR